MLVGGGELNVSADKIWHKFYKIHNFDRVKIYGCFPKHIRLV